MGRRGTRRLIAATAAIGLALGLAACAPEPPVIDVGVDQVEGSLPDDVRAELQAATERAIEATGSTGAIVGVYAPWSGQWVEGLGTTGPDGAAVEPDMTFKATAVTRAMTCDVLYALAAADAVELDDTVTELVETYPNVSDITLAQLCDSTSGIHGYMNALRKRLIANPERVWTSREIAAYGLAQDRAFAPGKRYADSDTGYVLLGIVLERVTGKTLGALYDEYVFEPLGLEKTTYRAAAGVPDDRLGGFYSTTVDDRVDCADPVDLTALSPSAGSAASGVTSTVDDLATYVQALATGARTYDVPGRWEDARQVSDGAPSWFTADGGAFQAGSLIGQHGSLFGYMTSAYADRETGLAVVVVLNNSRASSAIARVLSWQLAAIASKAPAADGRTAPEAGLPWTAESLADQIDKLAVCPA
ncbi:serine hydrolase domain-containing protein [Microbacterium sp. 179-B 1A2 NHS]|uniref:serine hydrolase domain-containing protein n=1 Tax=Microbacterium sp. 179-B 1A2 NHS TaxID=3142383 RepID=UPI0039A2D49F